MRYCVVGAGFSGAIIARALADAGKSVVLVDERATIGGNCHTARDAASGVMVHTYGPHIFHTSNEQVWSYVRQFGDWRPFRHRVQAQTGGRIYTMPINLLTINQFFGTVMRPEEARRFIEAKALQIESPANFEEQALSMVGPELYEAFFSKYTQKQWGMSPSHLPASVIKRLPLRFNYDDSYFAHKYQAIPEQGYTKIIENIIGDCGIEIRLGCDFHDITEQFEHVFYSGPIDRYFEFRAGRLGYRTLDFESFTEKGDYQGCAVMNYCDFSVPYTRITEHKHFAPWEDHESGLTVCYREVSRACSEKDTPYYPIRLAYEQKMLNDYIDLAKTSHSVSFIGRLGTYRYIDMDVAIAEALEASKLILENISGNQKQPAFFTNIT